MRKFKQNKLWRDKTIEVLQQQGSRIHWQKLDDVAFINQLRLKLLEEAQEVAAAQNRQELINELADVYEVIDTLIEANHITKKEIIEVQMTKKVERGSFTTRKFVSIAEHPIGSLAEHYCLLDPTKYPEII